MGQTQDTLESFKLNHEVVIRAAEKAQARTGKWINRDSNDLEGVLQDMIDNAPDKPTDQLLRFNMPVCDLDNVKDIEYGQCDTIFDCLEDIMIRNCPKLKLNDVSFPYDL